MELEAILLRFFQVVAKKLRHKHYKHTVGKHNDYMALVAGVGLDKYLRQYVRRESKELFEQRVKLTNHIVTAVSKNLADPFYKVPRSNSGRRVLTYTGDAKETQLQDVETLLREFWGDESWDDYMATRFTELNETDPNAFVAFEYKAFDNEVEMVKPYPYEVSSDMAVDYKKVNQVLQYLIAEDSHTYRTVFNDPLNAAGGYGELDPKKGMKEGKKYTLYTVNQTFQLRQVHETEATGMAALIEGIPVEKVDPQGNKAKYVLLGKDYYRFEEYLPHNCGEVPVFQAGYLRDKATKGRTFVSIIEPAVPYLKKTIKTNSELDLVATLLAFPQMVMYGEDCVETNCYKGYLDDGVTACGTCHGTGIKPTAPSAQDAVVISMPKSKEEMIPLRDMLTYLSPEVAIVQWQQQYVDYLTFKAQKIMFNSDIFSRKQIADTATGKELDTQNAYDTLYPFAIKFGKTWRKGTIIMAKLADRAKDLVASYTFGKDFKLKTLDTLIADLAEANDIGSPVLVRHLEYDIATIIFAEKPLEMQRYQLQQLHNPFQGKSEKEVALLLVSDLVSKKDKVLHANYGRIFDELEIDYATKGNDFYGLKRLEQRTAIYAKVDEIIADIEAENPAPVLDIGA